MGVGRKHEMRALGTLYNGKVPANAVPILDEPLLRVIAPFIADSIDADKNHLVSIPVPKDDLDIDPGTWWLIRSITVFDDDATTFSEGGFKVKGSKFWNAAHVKGNGIERVVIDTGGSVMEGVVCEVKRGRSTLPAIGAGRRALFAFDEMMTERFPDEMQYVRSFGTSYNEYHHMAEKKLMSLFDVQDNYDLAYLTLNESSGNYSFMHEVRKWVKEQNFNPTDKTNTRMTITDAFGRRTMIADVVYNPSLDAALVEYSMSDAGDEQSVRDDLVFRRNYDGSKWEIKKSPKVSRF